MLRSITREMVQLDLRALEEAGAIREVAELLRTHKGVIHFDRFYQELQSRERLSPTALGQGIAFPHARTDAVSEVVVAVGRSRAGVPSEKLRGRVHLIFVIGTPTALVREYLALIAALAKRLRDPALRDALMAAGDTRQFLEVLAPSAPGQSVR